MAENTKQEFQYLDIPDGSGGTERWWCEDAEARAAIEHLDPASAATDAICEDIVDDIVEGTHKTEGHDDDVIPVSGLKAALTKYGTDVVEEGLSGKSDVGHTHDDRYYTESEIDAKEQAIADLIPTQATSSNQLADKDFVNSSIATSTATYRGSYNLVSDLHLTITATNAEIATALATAVATADNNDYSFVQVPTANDKPTEIAKIVRFKNNGTEWGYEYELNNSGYTSDQWAAINSGVTSGLVSKLLALPSNAELTTLLNGKADKTATVSTVAYDTTNGKLTKTINGTTTDIVVLDTAPTSGSKKPVTSGAVYQAIQEALINPISDSSIVSTTTFNKRDVVSLNGTMYMADNATSDLPLKTPVVQGSNIVTQDGMVIIQGGTASSDWHSFG